MAVIHHTRGGEAWADWADAFAGRLAERAQEAEASRTVLSASVQEAEVAGFFGMIAPVGVGGQGGSFSEFMDVVRRMANGCASSAWTLSFLALHAWMVAKFGSEAQAEFFRDGKMPMAPAPLAPTGKAEPVEGGYRVSGRWEWATGINHADWVLVNGIDSSTGIPRFCALPIDEVIVEDNWQMSGMAATGSKAVVVDDKFVPEHMTLSAVHMAAGSSPGDALHAGSTLTYPLRAVLTMVAASPALGAAEASVIYFRDRMLTKMQAYGGGAKQGDVQTVHFRLGEATALVNAARALWHDAIAKLEAEGAKGAEAPVSVMVEIRLAAAHIVRLANQAVDILSAAAGASSGHLSAPLQRHLRDLQMMRGHVMFDWDRTASLAGRVALGMPTTPADLI